MDFGVFTLNIFDGTFETKTGGTILSSSASDLEFEDGYCIMNTESGASVSLEMIRVFAIDSLLYTGAGNVTLTDDFRIAGDNTLTRMTHTGLLDLSSSGSSFMFQSSGENNVVINSGPIDIMDDLHIDGDNNSFTTSATVNITDDVLFIGSGNTHSLTNSGDLTVESHFLMNTDTTLVTNQASGTIVINGAGTLGISFQQNACSIINSGTITVTTGRFRVPFSTVMGSSFTNNSGGILNLGGDFQLTDAEFTFDNFGTVNLTGRFDDMAGTESINNRSGATWNYFGVHNATLASEIELYANFDANTFNYNRSDGSAQEIIVPQDAYWHLTTSGAGVKEVQGNLDINGDMTISGTTIVDVQTETSDLTVAGNWTNTSIFFEGLQNVTFDGTADQLISTTGGEIFYNMGVNKASGTLSINASTQITNILTLTSGAFDLNSNSLNIVLESPGAITRSGGHILSEDSDNSSKIVRALGTTTGTYLFPFGNAAGDYIPLTVEHTAGDMGTTTISTYPTSSDNLPWPTTPDLVMNLNSVIGALPDNQQYTIDRFWQIDETGGSGTADITFTYADADVSLFVVGNEGDLEAQRYNTTDDKWEPAPLGQTQDPVANTVLVPSVTTFSPWTLALNYSPLPIEFVGFDAEHYDLDDQNIVETSWITKSESNSSYFEIQRSKDGDIFESIGTLEAAGISNEEKLYHFVDEDPMFGVSYYRVRQVDLDGNEEFSHADAVEISHIEITNIYPNPSTGPVDIIIQSEKDDTAILNIADLTGRIIVKETIQLESGNNTIPTDLEHLASGMYQIKIVYNNGNDFTQKEVLVK